MTLTKISFNGQAKFSCDHGFTLIGSTVITCLATGNWSDEIPFCKSKFECPALNDPANGIIVYATDSGVIQEKMTSYPIGTFLEIKCNHGFNADGENLITCSDQGAWDSDIEDCQPEELPIDANSVVKISIEFWKDFKDYLFNSCNLNLTAFCRRYPPGFETDLSTFELPESKEYEGMDSKLSTYLKGLLESKEFNSTTVGNFIELLLRNEEFGDLLEDSVRFVVCLYIDLIMLDDENEQVDKEQSDNINENIKKMLQTAALTIYRNISTQV